MEREPFTRAPLVGYARPLERHPSVSCEIWYCSSFLYRLLRGVPITSAVFEMFQPFSRSLPTRNARSAPSLNSRKVPAPAFVSPEPSAEADLGEAGVPEAADVAEEWRTVSGR